MVRFVVNTCGACKELFDFSYSLNKLTIIMEIKLCPGWSNIGSRIAKKLWSVGWRWKTRVHFYGQTQK